MATKARITRDFRDSRLFTKGKVVEIEKSFPPIYFVTDPETRIGGILISGEFELVDEPFVPFDTESRD